MAGDGCLDDEEEQFFDSEQDFDSGLLGEQIWIRTPDSVRERRHKFLRCMGWDVTTTAGQSDSDAPVDGASTSDIERIMSNDGAVLRNSDSENGFTEDSSESIMDEFGDDTSVPIDGLMNMIQMQREDSSSSSNSERSERRRSWWLKKLGVVACVVDRQPEEMGSCSDDSDVSGSAKNQRVKVRTNGKKSKDFSAIFTMQDIKAHDGAILTMKFSPDGHYLASGGEDGVVRVWRVMVREQTDEDDLPGDEPSCIYFKVNHNFELVPLYAGNEKKIKSGIMRRTSDPACVVIPPEVFWIDEKPVHEFRGHQGDVLDLSWSKDKHLLSSSVDKTARLWRVGCDSCLGVFQHSNYVTCLQFNPANESYFISGSIDGKVRLWEILKSRVVDWIDIREIVTAVCYRPDGKTGVVGTISGICRFFDASDNHLQLEAQVSLQDRKKSPFKRITGFEFSPVDQRKLMVTSADSQVRILDGVDVISKYKGLRNSGSQISASFTSDGKHIISASEDSNVYVWNYNNQDAAISNHVKSTSSCERFSASNASVAITWNGFESKDPVELQEDTEFGFHHRADSLGNNNMYLSPTGSFTLSQELFSEFLPKGTATWPEEKLPSATGSALGRSQYKFLKASCQNPSSTWGQVIVTAGWDGRIRSFRNYGLPVHQ